MISQTCTKCGVTKPVAEFYFNRGRGKSFTRCKACCASAQRARGVRHGSGRTPEQKAAYARRIGKVTCEYIPRARRLEIAAERRRLAGEARQAGLAVKPVPKPAKGSREWYAAASPEEIKLYRSAAAARFRKRYSSSAKAERTRTRNYKRRNPEQVDRWHKERQRRMDVQRDGTLTATVIACLIGQAKVCAYCGCGLPRGTAMLDHVIPLCRGGWHSISNVVVSCVRCNLSKGSKLVEEWVPVRRAT